MYIQKVPHAKRKKANQRLQKRIEKTKKILITKERTKEHWERIIRGESPSHRPVKKGATKRSKQLVVELSMFSNICQFHSLQIHHIKHNRTKFQMLKECFPNQFIQPKRVATTNFGKTHEIPKDLKTKLYNQ